MSYLASRDRWDGFAAQVLWITPEYSSRACLPHLPRFMRGFFKLRFYMNKFLADSFGYIVSLGASILLLVVFCASLAAMMQSFWAGLAIMIGGTMIVVSGFGALAVILSLYEEVKQIRALVDHQTADGNRC